jgi:hypothetical protein
MNNHADLFSNPSNPDKYITPGQSVSRPGFRTSQILANKTLLHNRAANPVLN